MVQVALRLAPAPATFNLSNPQEHQTGLIIQINHRKLHQVWGKPWRSPVSVDNIIMPVATISVNQSKDKPEIGMQDTNSLHEALRQNKTPSLCICILLPVHVNMAL